MFLWYYDVFSFLHYTKALYFITKSSTYITLVAFIYVVWYFISLCFVFFLHVETE